MLATILPKISVAEFIHKIKGSSSHFINLNLGNKKQHHACGNVLGVLEYTPLDEPNQPRDLSLGGDESTGDLPPNPIYGVYGCARSCFFG